MARMFEVVHVDLFCLSICDIVIGKKTKKTQMCYFVSC